jgi:hypothetical protein
VCDVVLAGEGSSWPEKALLSLKTLVTTRQTTPLLHTVKPRPSGTPRYSLAQETGSCRLIKADNPLPNTRFH